MFVVSLLLRVLLVSAVFGLLSSLFKISKPLVVATAKDGRSQAFRHLVGGSVAVFVTCLAVLILGGQSGLLVAIVNAVAAKLKIKTKIKRSDMFVGFGPVACNRRHIIEGPSVVCGSV